MPPARKSAYSKVMREMQQQQTAERPEVQQPEVSEVHTFRSPDIQQSTSSETQIAKGPDSRKSKHPEWEQQTIYLSPALKERVKIHAVRAKLEISEIVNTALREYLDQHPDF